MNIIIIDDEAPARERLRSLLDDNDDYVIIGEGGSGDEALTLCEKHDADVLLLDIRMPGMSGIEAARHLMALEKPPAIIFTTAYGEYALEAFESQAIGYLMKPVRRERLIRALNHAARPTRPQLSALAELEPKAARRTQICARVGLGLQLIPLEDIYYFQADQKYTSVHHVNGEVLIDDPLKELEQEFDPDFVRIHRNALVAFKYLDGVEKLPEGGYVAHIKECGDTLSVSRRHAPELRRRIRGKKSS